MKVILDLKHVKVVSVNKDDKDNVLSITIEPSFTTANGLALALSGETQTNKGRKIEEFKLNVSGKTGRTVLETVVPGVTATPKIDEEEPPAAGTSAATPKPPNRRP